MQTNVHCHHYLNDTAWSVVYDKSFTWETKTEWFIDLFLALGLRHATDDTIRVLLAILMIGHGRELTPDEAYAEVHDLKGKLAGKRNLNNDKPTMFVFPQDPSVFMQMHPGVYRENDPPVASRIDDIKIRNMIRPDLIPTRKRWRCNI